MTTMHIEFPDELAQQLEQLVKEGWVEDRNRAIVEALRRFLESRRPEVMGSQVMSDVEWGLHGKD